MSDSLEFLLGFTTRKQFEKNRKKHGYVAPHVDSHGVQHWGKSPNDSPDKPAHKPSPKKGDKPLRVGFAYQAQDPVSKSIRGFMDKIFQKGLNNPVVDTTLDVLTRARYGTESALEEGQTLKWKREDQQGNDSFFEDAQDIPGIIGAFGKGFSGEQKHLAVQGIDRAYEHHKEAGDLNWSQKHLHAHPTQKAIVGFAYDVSLDPLSYVGVGTITKPLKAAAIRDVDKELVKDLADRKIVSKTGDALTAKDWTSIIAGKQMANVPPVGLTKSQRRKWFKEHTVRGRDAFKSSSDSTFKLQHKLYSVEKVREQLAPKHLGNIKKLEAYQSDLQRQYNDVVNKIGKGTYAEAIARADTKIKSQSIHQALEGAAPNPDHQLIGGEFTEHLDDAVHHAHLTNLLQSFGIYAKNKNALEKLIEGTPEYDVAKKSHDTALTNLKGYTKDWHYGNEFKGFNTVLEHAAAALKLGEHDTIVQKWLKNAKDLSIERDSRGLNKEHHTYKAYTKRIDQAFTRARREQARLLYGLISHSARGTKPEQFASEAEKAELINIDRQLENVNKALKGDHIEGLTHGMAETEHVASTTGNTANVPKQAGSLPTGDMAPAALKKKKKELETRRNEITYNALQKEFPDVQLEAPDEVKHILEQAASDGVNPVKRLYAAHRAGEIDGDWIRAFSRHAENRFLDVRQRKIETKIRRQRELLAGLADNSYDMRNLPDKLQSMFYRAKDKKGVPVHKITLEDGTVVTNTMKDRKVLTSHVTEADRKAADSYNKNAIKDWRETHKNKYGGDFHNPLQGKSGVVTQPLNRPAEWYTFERMFREQHGMSMQAASADLQLKTGNYVTIRHGKNVQRIPHTFFKDYIRQHPESLGPNGLGFIVPKNLSYALKELPKELRATSYGQMLKRFKSLSKEELRNSWTKIVKRWLKDSSDDEVNKTLDALYARKQKLERDKRKVDRTGEYSHIPMDKMDSRDYANLDDNMGEVIGHFGESELHNMDQVAWNEATSKFHESLLEDSHVSDFNLDKPILIPKAKKGAVDSLTTDEIHDSAIHLAESNYEVAAEQAKLKFAKAEDKQGAAIGLQAELNRLKDQLDQSKKVLNGAKKEAFETQKLLLKRVEEEMLLQGLKKEQVGRNQLRFTFAGQRIADVPTGDILFKSVELFSKVPLIEKTRQAWGEAFHPASKLAPEINKARLREQFRVPELIKQNTLELSHTFRSIKPRTRVAAFDKLRKSGEIIDPTAKKIKSEFDNLVPYMDGSLTIGEHRLTADDVSAFLPPEFVLVAPNGGKASTYSIKYGSDIVKLMPNMPKGTDPMKALWALRVATEKAQAKYATFHTLTQTFGVRRELRPGLKREQLSPHGELVEQLHDGHGWVTVKDIGHGHYFPPDVASEIQKMIDMMKPRNTAKLLQIYDKALHHWKAAVTIYNPGYYTRNGIGEVMMGLFDGLVDPVYYAKASRYFRHKQPDATKEALKELNPWTKYSATRKPSGSNFVKLPSGEKLSVDDIEVLFHQSGLKSGFVSTEYDELFPRGGTARATLPGRGAARLNEGIRHMGEKYEDFFRIAHFIYRLEKAPRGMKALEAGEWAGNFVRKYHFDYTDFTPFEKTMMMRVFPFYKWTRKAFPLMVSMVFTKPGNVTLYPKAMQNLSYATGGTDPAEDTNGVIPNYEASVPKWMQGLYAYPVGTGDTQGRQDYARLATPGMDIYHLLSDPKSGGWGMVSPGIEQPLNQLFGKNLSPDKNFFYDLNTKEDRLHNMLTTTPLGSLLDKQWKADSKGKESPWTEPGGSIDEKLLSFLTGIGIYEEPPPFNPQKKKATYEP